jgi:hypothetical protein
MPLRPDVRRSAARSASSSSASHARTRAGVTRIAGEINGLGLAVSATTVKKILRQAGIGPAGARAGLLWSAFLRQQAQAFAFGAWMGVRITLMPSVRKASSKA